MKVVRAVFTNQHYTATGFTFKKQKLVLQKFTVFDNVIFNMDDGFCYESVFNTITSIDPFDDENVYSCWAFQSHPSKDGFFNNPIRNPDGHVNDYTSMSKYRTVSLDPYVINSNEGLLQVLMMLDSKYPIMLKVI